MPFDGSSSKRLFIGLGLIAVFGIITFALAAATLGTVNKHYTNLKNLINTPDTTTRQPTLTATLATSIRIQDVMTHLRQLQRIATANNETRTIGTPGFTQTLDYITATLRDNTNYIVNTTYFNVRQFQLASDPILVIYNSTIPNGRNLTYSKNLNVAEFYHVRFSTGGNITKSRLVAIPDLGCSDADWTNATTVAGGSLANQIVLVKRGRCTFREKGVLAAKYNARGILFYNHGLTPTDIAPIEVSLGQENNLPALFLSSTLGDALAAAAPVGSNNVQVEMTINVLTLPNTPVGNICADTPTGNISQTIVIGSHSDSVPDGPGINDNGMSHSSFHHSFLSVFICE